MSPTSSHHARQARRLHGRNLFGGLIAIAAMILLWVSATATAGWSLLMVSVGGIGCANSGGCGDFPFFVALAVFWGGSIAGLVIGHRGLVRANMDLRKSAIAGAKGLGLIGAAALIGTWIIHIVAFA